MEIFVHPFFKDRQDAGRQVGKKLTRYQGVKGVIVLALPRGGVPIGFEIAKALSAPLEVFIVRKLPMPGQEELALGAIASGGGLSINHDIVRSYSVSRERIYKIAIAEKRELKRREKIYGAKLTIKQVTNRTVILVDDGIATGATMRAAIKAIRKMKPLKIVMAVPVAAKSVCTELSKLVNETFCSETPDPFFGVGIWYESFPQMTDKEVQEILKQSKNLRR